MAIPSDKESIFDSKAFKILTISIAFGVDTFAYSVVIPFFPIIIQNNSGNIQDIGLLLALFSVGLIVSSLFFGILSDHFSNRKLAMVLGLASMIASSLLMAFNQSFISLGLGRFLQGVATGAVWSAGLAFIADLHTNGEDLGKTMSWIFAAYCLGEFIGPLVGGYLFEIGSWAPFIAITALAVIDGILRLLISDRGKKVKSTDESIIDIMRRTLKNKKFNVNMGLLASFSLLLGSLEVAFTLQAENFYHLSSGNAGLCYLVLILPQLCFSPVGGYLYDKYGLVTTMFPGVVGISLCFYALSIPVISLAVFLFIIGLVGFLLAILVAPFLPEVTKVIHSDSYGFAYGLYNCVFAVGLLFGSPMASFMMQYYNFTVYSISLATAYLLSNSYLIYLYRNLDHKTKELKLKPFESLPSKV